ncbi:MAG TPA: type II secretion system protein [Candidatus Paceibacterota bacterium]
MRNFFPERADTGMTLVEILIVVAITAALAGGVIFNLFNYLKFQDLNSDLQAVVSFLRDAQNRAITQEEASEWGVYFDNTASDQGWFAVFKGTSYVSAASRRNLSSKTEFKNIPTGGSKFLYFNKLTGIPNTSDSIEIGFKSENCPSNCKIITIRQNGSISY